MRQIDVRQALRLSKARRTKPYRYKPGKFMLTASFRDDSIDRIRVAMVAALAKYFTQKQIAGMLGCGTSTVSKCMRIQEAFDA